MHKVLVNGLLLNEQFTGVQYYTENVLKAIGSKNNKNFDIEVIISKSYNGQIQTNNRLKVKKTEVDTLNRIKRISFENFKLANYYRQNSYNLYHSPSYILPYYWKYPSVLTVHDLIALEYPEFCQKESVLYYNLFLPRSIRKATKIIAVSNKIKDDIIKRFEILPDNIEVIYHGIDNNFKKVQSEEIINKLRTKYALPQQFILFVGNIEPKKNLERLIEAFYFLKRETAIKHKLVVVGRNGWKYKSVYHTISRLKINREILFTGYVPQEDLPGIYSSADVFVFPSLYEGFGIPPLEAMACETPVLVSNQGALPETTGSNCLQVNPYDVNDIAKGINNMLTDKTLRKKAIEICKKWVKNFTWEKAGNSTLKVYENVLSHTYHKST